VPSHALIYISGAVVEQVESIKFFSVQDESLLGMELLGIWL
jgi:hypothetical protein